MSEFYRAIQQEAWSYYCPLCKFVRQYGVVVMFHPKTLKINPEVLNHRIELVPGSDFDKVLQDNMERPLEELAKSTLTK